MLFGTSNGRWTEQNSKIRAEASSEKKVIEEEKAGEKEERGKSQIPVTEPTAIL